MKLSFALFLGEIMYKYAAISSLRIAISTSLFYTSHSYSYFSDHMDLLMVDLNVSDLYCFILCINRYVLNFSVVLLLFFFFLISSLFLEI